MNNRRNIRKGKAFVILSVFALLAWFNWPVLIPILELFRDHSMPHVLETVDTIGIRQHTSVYENDHLSGISGSTIALLDAQHNPEMFRLLRTSTGFHSSTQQTEWDFTLGVRGYEGKHWTDFPGPSYYYCSRTGEFGYGKEWCYTSPRFRVWMLALKVRTPKPKPLHIMHGPGPHDPVVIN